MQTSYQCPQTLRITATRGPATASQCRGLILPCTAACCCAPQQQHVLMTHFAVSDCVSNLQGSSARADRYMQLQHDQQHSSWLFKQANTAEKANTCTNFTWRPTLPCMAGSAIHRAGVGKKHSRACAAGGRTLFQLPWVPVQPKEPGLSTNTGTKSLVPKLQASK